MQNIEETEVSKCDPFILPHRQFHNLSQGTIYQAALLFTGTVEAVRLRKAK